MSDSSLDNLPEDQLPQEVVAALQGQYGPSEQIPEAVDQAVLSDAASYLRTVSDITPHRPDRRRRVWVGISAGTLAAAALVAVMLPDAMQNEVAPEGVAMRQPAELADETAGFATATLDPNDIDQNGEVNILDAFALARTIGAGDSGVHRWDQNGDGYADHADIKLIAERAVML